MSGIISQITCPILEYRFRTYIIKWKAVHITNRMSFLDISKRFLDDRSTMWKAVDAHVPGCYCSLRTSVEQACKRQHGPVALPVALLKLQALEYEL